MLIIIITVVALILAWAVYSYNTIITLNNQVRSAWSDIDVQLTRRHELIPQLLNTVKAYKDYERETLELTTLIRSAEQQQTTSKQEKLENKINTQLGKLLLLQESYPDLKSNQTFLELMEALTETEDKLQFARRYYNGSVKVYNTKLQQVPDNLIANLFRFQNAEFFEVSSPDIRAAIEVKTHD